MRIIALSLLVILLATGCRSVSPDDTVELHVTLDGVQGRAEQIRCLTELPSLLEGINKLHPIRILASTTEDTSEAIMLVSVLNALGYTSVELTTRTAGWSLYPPGAPGGELRACNN